MSLNNGGLGLGFVFTAEDMASEVMRHVQSAYTELEAKVKHGSEQIAASFKKMGGGLNSAAAGVQAAALPAATAEAAAGIEQQFSRATAAADQSAFALSNVQANALKVGLAIAAAGAAAAMMMVQSAKAADALEYQLAGVKLAANATASEMKMMHDSAIQAGIATQYGPMEAAKALQSLAQNFHSADTAAKLLLPTLDLAAASLQQLDPAGAAKTIGQAIAGYGRQVSDAGAVTDQLVRITTLLPIHAEELSTALAHTSGAAAMMGGSMKESLITVGLLSKVMGDVNEASTGAKEAMLKFAEKKVVADVQGLGVKLQDLKTGGFRPILDIIQDLGVVMDRTMSSKAQGEYLTNLFGMRGGPAVSALIKQLRDGITDMSGHLLKGADAIAYLRGEMDKSAGSAKAARDALLNTGEGQAILMRGSIATMADLVGEPFAQLQRPVVEKALAILNQFISIVNQAPMGLKKFVAGVMWVTAGLAMLTGLLIAAPVAWFLLSAAFTVAAAALAPLIAAIGPFLPLIAGVLAGVAVLVGGFRVAWDRDIGGLASGVTHVWNQIKLFFAGLSQLATQGGFSGDVRKQLGGAESAMRPFIIRIGMILYRLGSIWDGVVKGFEAGVVALTPWWNVLIQVGATVWTIFKMVLTSLSDLFDLSGTSVDSWVTFGKVIGWVGAILAGVLLLALLPIALSMVLVAAAVWFIVKVFQVLGYIIGAVAYGIFWFFTEGIPNAISYAVAAFPALWEGLKKVVAMAFPELLYLYAGFMFLWEGIKWIFLKGIPGAGTWLGVKLTAMVQLIKDLFSSIPDAIRQTIDDMTRYMAKLAALIPEKFRPEFLNKFIVEHGDSTDQQNAGTNVSTAAPAPKIGFSSNTQPTVPAAAETAAAASFSKAQTDATAAGANLTSQSVDGRPIIVQSQISVDGETLATAVGRGQRAADVRSYRPGADGQ